MVGMDFTSFSGGRFAAHHSPRAVWFIKTGSIPAQSTYFKKLQTKGEQTMARIPMVTRTIQTTKANVLCLNIVEGEPFNEVVTLPRTYKDEKSLMKMVEKAINTDSVKAVHVVDTKVEETLYGMSEADFIVNAKILPKREPQADAPTDETNHN